MCSHVLGQGDVRRRFVGRLGLVVGSFSALPKKTSSCLLHSAPLSVADSPHVRAHCIREQESEFRERSSVLRYITHG